jgi:transmembrane sensor
MSSNDIEIKASEWLARIDRDDPTSDDIAALELWKAADPRHAAAYARLAATWQALDRVQALRPSTRLPIDNDYLSARMRSPDRQRLSILSMAAAVLILIAGFWFEYPQGGSQTFSTSRGGYQRIVLKDQSTIELNTDSEVRVAMTPQMRKIELVRGEASFEVAHDVARPFIVSAGDTAVRAVGTKFDVRRLDNSIEVIVNEGNVIVGAPELLEDVRAGLPSEVPQLGAGQTALASGSRVKLKALPQNDLARKLSWQNQMLVFDDDSLADVVAQFNRYNARQLVIADPSLGARHIGGYFRPTNLDTFIGVLQSDFGIRVTSQDNQLVLTAAASN